MRLTDRVASTRIFNLILVVSQNEVLQLFFELNDDLERPPCELTIPFVPPKYKGVRSREDNSLMIKFEKCVFPSKCRLLLPQPKCSRIVQISVSMYSEEKRSEEWTPPKSSAKEN